MLYRKWPSRLGGRLPFWRFTSYSTRLIGYVETTDDRCMAIIESGQSLPQRRNHQYDFCGGDIAWVANLYFPFDSPAAVAHQMVRLCSASSVKGTPAPAEQLFGKGSLQFCCYWADWGAAKRASVLDALGGQYIKCLSFAHHNFLYFEAIDRKSAWTGILVSGGTYFDGFKHSLCVAVFNFPQNGLKPPTSVGECDIG